MTTKTTGTDLVAVYKAGVKLHGAGACPSDAAIAAGLDAVLAALKATTPSPVKRRKAA